MDYAQSQDDEILVLESMYQEDFERVELKSAWNKTSERAFRLRLRSDDDSDMAVVLLVTFTATYPRTPPLLELKGLDTLHERTRSRVSRIVQERPRQLAGEVMMDIIVNEVVDALNDAARAKAQKVLPSLDDERAMEVAAAQMQEDEQREAEQQRQQAAKDEAARLLREGVEQELQLRAARQATPAREAPTANVPPASDSVAFDEAIQLTLPDGSTTEFTTVQLVSIQGQDRMTEEFLARPSNRLATLLKLRRVSITPNAPLDIFRRNLSQLEEELGALKKLRHQHVNTVYSFKLERQVIHGQDSQLGWSLSILSELSNRGSLEEALEDGQTISLERARQWTLDLLGALEFLHHHGVAHKQITPANIRLYRSGNGLTTPQLSGTCYAHRLDVLLGSDGRNRSPSWRAPETRTEQSSASTKIDIWDFGVVLTQMLLGREVISSFASPVILMQDMNLTDSFNDLLRKFFAKDPSKRPSAFELIPSEFFRSSAAAIEPDRHSGKSARTLSTGNSQRPVQKGIRHGSFGVLDSPGPTLSRYTTDFTELAKLGKGGFGEVVKVRNKIDNGHYAIKKIKSQSRAELEQVLSEVMLLQRLNHPYAVRYYSAWVEDDSDVIFADSSAISNSESSSSSPSYFRSNAQPGFSSRGLDLLSSEAYNAIEFGDDEDDTDTEDDAISSLDDGIRFEDSTPAADNNESAVMDRDAIRASKEETSGFQHESRIMSSRDNASILYIQMELCERRTLRDPIIRGMPADSERQWDMLRQILQGLEHIHGHGIIHRDLKPDNIFIDQAGNPRIGDFGLATTTHIIGPSRRFSSQAESGDLSKGIGTALYIAPELQRQSKLKYNNKVDMYSLGVIFFEMCYSLQTAMERDKEICKIRAPHHELPSAFNTPEKAIQGSIILSLIHHNPSERPSSTELLRSGRIPTLVEDEMLRSALENAQKSDSPIYQKLLSVLFTPSEKQQIKDMAWDAKNVQVKKLIEEDQLRIRLRSIVKSTMELVLRNHGAEQGQQTMIHPLSMVYNGPEVFQVLDSVGNHLQIPYDFTLPRARALARHQPGTARTYIFGQLARNALGGGPPGIVSQLHFDIASQAGFDTVIYDAEAIKAINEIADRIPALIEAKVAYHLNHSEMLDAILDHCRVDALQQDPVKRELSKLGFNEREWKQVRDHLRSPEIDVPSTVLDELSKFDLREPLDKIEKRLATLLATSPKASKRVTEALRYLDSVTTVLISLGVRRPVFISPLSSYNEAYYRDGILFQAVIEKRKRKPLAVGGRFDSLIRTYCPPNTNSEHILRAVGFQISLDFVANMALHKQQSILSGSNKFKSEQPTASEDPTWTARRCEVLILPTSPSLLTSSCPRLLAALWAADISAEVASASEHGIESIYVPHQKTSITHGFIVTVRNEAATTVRVRNTTTDVDAEIPPSDMTSHIRAEMRERDSALLKARHGRGPPPALTRGSSHPEHHHHHHHSDMSAQQSPVQVLVAQHRSKKSNRNAVVRQARERWAERCDDLKSRAVVAVETTDKVLEQVLTTRLGEPEGWRKVVQGMVPGERAYVGQIQEELAEYRAKWAAGEGGREVGLFNFRTGWVGGYDVGL